VVRTKVVAIEKTKKTRIVIFDQMVAIEQKQIVIVRLAVVDCRIVIVVIAMGIGIDRIAMGHTDEVGIVELVEMAEMAEIVELVENLLVELV